jgi:hypothetical protein
MRLANILKIFTAPFSRLFRNGKTAAATHSPIHEEGGESLYVSERSDLADKFSTLKDGKLFPVAPHIRRLFASSQKTAAYILRTAPKRFFTYPGRPGVHPMCLGVNPGCLGVNPGCLGVYPERLGVNPERLGVNPERLGVNPECLGVNPERLGVNPGRLGVNPERLGVNPECLGVYPERLGVRRIYNDGRRRRGGETMLHSVEQKRVIMENEHFVPVTARREAAAHTLGISFAAFAVTECIWLRVAAPVVGKYAAVFHVPRDCFTAGARTERIRLHRTRGSCTRSQGMTDAALKTRFY